MYNQMVEDNGKDCTSINKTSKEYRQDVADSQVRDLDAGIEKLNSTYQQELKG